MKNIGPVSLSKLAFKKIDFHQQPKSIVDCLVNLLMDEKPSVSELEAYEEISQNRNVYEQELRKRREEAKAEGRFCPYELVRDQIVGYSFERPDDDPELSEIRKVAHLHGDAYDHVRNLDPDDFERLCYRVLKQIGAKESAKTKRSGDEGLDFAAILPLAQAESFFGPDHFFEDLDVLVVGQAKAYSETNKISLSDIRELVGSYAMFSLARSAKLLQRYDFPFTRKLCEPTIPLYMTTGNYTRTAKNRAEEFGVITKNGSQIATFLCIEGVGIEVEDGKKVFKDRRFEEWLNE